MPQRAAARRALSVFGLRKPAKLADQQSCRNTKLRVPWLPKSGNGSRSPPKLSLRTAAEVETTITHVDPPDSKRALLWAAVTHLEHPVSAREPASKLLSVIPSRRQISRASGLSTFVEVLPVRRPLLLAAGQAMWPRAKISRATGSFLFLGVSPRSPLTQHRLGH